MTAEEEIAAGLRNAVERGVSLDKAAQSFINAGYAESAVRSAARAVKENLPIAPSTSQLKQTVQEQPSDPQQQQQAEHIETSEQSPESSPASASPISVPMQIQQSSSVSQKPAEGGVSKTKMIILVAVLVLLLVFLGASIAFRDQILALIT